MSLGCRAEPPTGEHGGQLSHDRRGRRGIRRRHPQIRAHGAGGGANEAHPSPLNGLRVLDAAARHLSLHPRGGRAGGDAGGGRPARSVRSRIRWASSCSAATVKGLGCTPEAEAGLGGAAAGFLEFEESVRAMQAGQSSRVADHRCAARPHREVADAARSPRSRASDSELRFVLVPADEAIDFTEANLDLAIRWGRRARASMRARRWRATDDHGRARRAAASTCASPGRAAWPRTPASLVRVADAGLALDAAAEGLGRATVPELLGPQRSSNRAASSRSASPRVRKLGYWLVAPLAAVAAEEGEDAGRRAACCVSAPDRGPMRIGLHRR